MRKPVKQALLEGLLICAAGIVTAQANTLVTFSVDMATNLANGSFNPPPPVGTGTDVVYARGTFMGWASPGLPLVRQGTSTVYTNTIDDTTDLNGRVMSYKFTINGVGNFESTACWDNRAAKLPTTSGASLVLPTPYYGDIGPGQVINVTFQVDMSEQIVLGRFVKGGQVEVRGSMNGWVNTGLYLTNDPSILVTNHNAAFPPAGIVTSNVYTLTVPITSGTQIPGLPATNAMMEWKAVMNGGVWENPGPTNADDAGNRFWCNGTNQVLPIVNFSDLAYAPLAKVTLNVDMTAIAMYDPYYVYPSVVVWGTYDNWAGGTFLTNNPNAANTNVFSGVITVVQGADNIYQFRYTNSYNVANNVNSGWVYDYVNGIGPTRRTISVPAPVTATNLPVVFFNDLSTNDYLAQDTVVTFNVNMLNAVGSEGHAWASGEDVYVNGDFDGTGWLPWDPISLMGRKLSNIPSGGSFYSFQYTFPYGHRRRLDYQYSMGYSVQNTATADETTSGVNHTRYIRTTNGVCVFPMDTFGVMGAEDKFGSLAVGAATAGGFPVTWVGYPGVRLQGRTNLTLGTWQDYPATSGLNSTNWPNDGRSRFFRLVQP